MSQSFPPKLLFKVDCVISQNLWHKQLPLIADQAILNSENSAIELSIDRVSAEVRREKDQRFYSVAKQWQKTWRYPIQFSEIEIEHLEPHLRSLNWALDTNSGNPINFSFWHDHVKFLIGSWLPTQLQQQRRRTA